ncbi:hypothetical protein CC78DRAFT_581677 [Lojkania enalia]|uniref:VOC domain-containing protein n=1 Tax=Lojkania enalia TaxID=147567 RepID=A0A9P4K7M4_9PLEO|nr:hypothetical protein CC78DRAFT_581677 [Didymosphaeria enalia]
MRVQSMVEALTTDREYEECARGTKGEEWAEEGQKGNDKDEEKGDAGTVLEKLTVRRGHQRLFKRTNYRARIFVKVHNMSTESAETKGTPPVPPVGAPCWIEIMSVDPAKLKEFYAALFPAWNWKPSTAESEKDGMIFYDFDQPKGISGGIIKLPEGSARTAELPMGLGMTVYYFVNSIDDIGKQIEGLGGTCVLPKTEQSTNGWYANYKDPEGNRFGVYEVNWANPGM